jgi:hypothetical protein
MRKRLAPVAPGKEGYRGYLPFRFGQPHKGYLGRIERAAGIAPLLAHQVMARPGSPQKAATSVLMLYRAVLDGLVAAKKLTPFQAWTLGNCRPAGVHAKPKPRMCGMAYLCPSCWSRRAAEWWKRIDPALFPPTERRRAPAAAADLVLATRRLAPADVLLYEEKVRGVIAERLADRMDGGPQLLGSRSLEMRRLRKHFFWAIEGLVVDVSYRGRRAAGWKVAVRQLFAVPAGADFDVPDARLRRLATPSRAEAADMVIRLCRYPRGLLRDREGRPTPAWIVDRYQESVAGRRLWATYGDLPAAALVRRE